MAPVGKTITPNSSIGDDLAFPIPKSAVQASSAVPRQLNRISSSSYISRIVLIFATSYFSLTSAQGSIVASAQAVANFSVSSTSYNCSSNMICLGEAHAYTAGAGLSGIPDIPEGGRLSLIQYNNNYSLGIAYYNHPVKFLDLSSNRSASFSTNFTIDVRHYLGLPGYGMTFLISANNSYTGSSGGWFAIFDDVSYSTPFRSIVVEFDTYYDQGYPINDVNANHVSFDFSNITGIAPVDAMDINVNLTDENTKYAWIDYSSETLLLEVRVSYNNSRPTNPLSSYKLNLVDFVQENMWVGFSSASGSTSSNFYIGDWAFESYGIPVPVLFPAPATPPSSEAPKGGKSGQRKLGITVGISVGIVTFFLACVFAALLVWQRKFCSRGHLEDLVATEEDLMKLEGMPERFSYKHLSVATRAFSEEMKLGQGGFGSVYRGVLPSLGIPVAVKKINSDSNQGEKEFMAEVSIISRLRHRNLIQLQGWCKDAAREKYLLVYELMPNGSLDKVLFGLADSPSVCLSWEQRFNVVTGTAAALDYLHQGWKRQVIHRDVKSSNIMLDQEWNAKLGDFGLARLVDHQRAATTTIVAGTYGYIAPEAATSGRFTEKTDVYAFGAVVLEIACGRRAFSVDFPPEEFFLVDWVWHCLSAGVLLNTVDERLVDYDTYWIKVVLIVGLWCSHPNPLARPSMRHVVQVLAGDVPVPSIPASKPAAVFSSDPPNISIDSLLGRKSRNGAKSRSGSISLVSMKSFDSAQASALKSSAPSLISNL